MVYRSKSSKVIEEGSFLSRLPCAMGVWFIVSVSGLFVCVNVSQLKNKCVTELPALFYRVEIVHHSSKWGVRTRKSTWTRTVALLGAVLQLVVQRRLGRFTTVSVLLSCGVFCVCQEVRPDGSFSIIMSTDEHPNQRDVIAGVTKPRFCNPVVWFERESFTRADRKHLPEREMFCKGSKNLLHVSLTILDFYRKKLQGRLHEVLIVVMPIIIIMYVIKLLSKSFLLCV